MAQCLIENGTEINLVEKGLLQEDEAKISTKPVQLKGASGGRLEGGEKEVVLSIRLLQQSVWNNDDVKEEWLQRKFYEATIKYVVAVVAISSWRKQTCS